MVVDILGHVYGIDNYDERTTSEIILACRDALQNNKSSWEKTISSAKKVRRLEESVTPKRENVSWSGNLLSENVTTNENYSIIPFECKIT